MKFTPEDFCPCIRHSEPCEDECMGKDFADFANAKLQEWLGDAELVYKLKEYENDWTMPWRSLKHLVICTVSIRKAYVIKLLDHEEEKK